MTSDLILIGYWWLMFLLLGLITFPLVSRILNIFFDKGWIASKVFSWILLSFIIFIFGYFHILPFTQSGIFFVILLILFGVILISKKRGLRRYLQIIRENAKIFIFEEILLFSCLAVWSLIRGFQPNIEGLEKFMDFGFVNSILRSEFFPPQDMWFAGESINYYYFGHLQAAVVTKLSGIDSAYTYNLLLGTIFAFAFTLTFSLSANLVNLLREANSSLKKIGKKEILVAGLISAILLTIGGNLHSTYYATIKGESDSYWYPDATRFIGYNPNNPNDKTIHEFPIYSFVVADLHGHMNDIPTVLLYLSVLVAFLAAIGKKAEKNKELKYFVFTLSLCLAAMYMTNSWDFPIYGGVLALSVFLVLISKEKGKVDYMRIFKSLLSYGIPILLLAIVFALPFAFGFSPMTEGIGFVNARSLLWQLLILWGFFLFYSICFLLFAFWRLKNKKNLLTGDNFIASLLVVSIILLIIPEFIYVKDIYIAEYHRANTMFKLVYQSFVMFSLAGGYILIRLKGFLRRNKYFQILFTLIFLVGFAGHMNYISYAIKGYYGELKPERYKGLYGLNFLNSNKDDYEAILWLKENIKEQSVILEAVGDSYTMFNRVSSMTGLPTVEGWIVHEWLWRGGYDKPSARQADVKLIYEGEDEGVAEYLLKKYQVEYVFLGELEKEKYPSLVKDRFEKLGEEVFSSGETKIYRLKQ
jgi:uncharacterized membrane protein